jgi:hypothetical protein
MPTTPNRPQDDASQTQDVDRDAAPVADEPGPHDVPDDEVIEHTLPSTSRRGGDSSRPS